jgi:hypothetical protein
LIIKAIIGALTTVKDGEAFSSDDTKPPSIATPAAQSMLTQRVLGVSTIASRSEIYASSQKELFFAYKPN